ncbi:MAG: ComF family protein [Ignavibacteriaceae bacterium]
MKSINAFSDFFIPRYCPSCKKKLKLEENCFCGECISSIERADSSRLSSEYQRKFASTEIISGFTSLFVFEKDQALQQLIHSIKYNKRFLNAKYLGKLIGENLGQEIINWNINILVPVPLHPLRKVERGFNQSKYIAIGIGKELGINVKSNLLKRIRYTETQTNLTLEEREENILNAFQAKHKRMIERKTFLLVDDVITTGATIRECGKTLLENGAAKVFACSAAIAE